MNISGCTVTGSISTNGKYAGGLVGIVQGTTNITNCKSDVTINSSTNINNSKDGTHGGFVGVNSGTVNITGSVFSGKLLSDNGTGNCGGFVGWGGSVTISDSLYAPADINTANAETEVVNGTVSYPSRTFARDTVGTINNSYYTRTLGTPQGKQAYTITAGDNVTLSLSGTATTYNVSGIIAYKDNSGLKYGNTFYAGNGDNVTLTLSHDTPTGYTFTGYTASAGTIDGTALTMPESDVVINAVDAVNTYTVTWVDGDGNSTTDTVAYGTVPTAPQNPTKTGNAQYSYTFSGWDKDITAVTGDVTYTAQFTASVNKYTAGQPHEKITEIC